MPTIRLNTDGTIHLTDTGDVAIDEECCCTAVYELCDPVSIEYTECEGSATIYVEPNVPSVLSSIDPPPEVVEVGGTCYEFICKSLTAVDTFSVDAEHANCQVAACSNPCAPDPAMECTVTATDANLPVTWCGITWEKSAAGGGPADPLGPNQRRSGQPATVCPTTYNVSRYSLTGPPVRGANATWKYGTDLSLYREYRNISIVGWSAEGTNRLRRNADTDRHTFKGTGNPVNWTTTNPFGSLNEIGLLGTATPVAPTYSDYLITDDFFGSYTTGGVTYGWAKGAGW